MSICLVLSACGIREAAAQDQSETVTLDELLSSAQDWARENLDDEALRSLQGADRQTVQRVLKEFQRRFRGEYILDLAGLKEAAQQAVSLLESHPDTQPYALWLKNRLDYLDVADQFRLIIPPPKLRPGQPTPRRREPTPQKEREVWVSQVSARSYPDNARPFLPKLKSIFAAEHVPTELVWIAEVESSFDPRVRSPAGAAGLFQLMPATAKRYGLRTGWPFDQRLTLQPSAQAAAHYLRDLHRRFNDWRLALAAYNAGEGTVEHLLAAHKARTYDEIAGRLPIETQMYVPKVEATLFRREGIKLAQLHVTETALPR